MQIALLHTMQGNIDIFNDAAASLGIPAHALRHEVRADLRESVQQTGGLSPDTTAQVVASLNALSSSADGVVVTCATISPVVDALPPSAKQVIRADVALAKAAGKTRGRVAILCAVDAVAEPTKRLFTQHANEETTIDIIGTPDAWTHFTNGDKTASLASVAGAADAAYEAGASLVVFAHPWMASAGELVTKGPRPLDSARAALQALLHAAG